MSKLSVVISAYNEGRNIKDCLESVRGLADEIIVIDNSSTDKTGEIARKYTKKVFEQKNDPKNIDPQKNFGFSKATGDWILSLDADERITPELTNEISQVAIGFPEKISFLASGFKATCGGRTISSSYSKKVKENSGKMTFTKLLF